MDRVTHPTAAPGGRFTDGDEGANIPATVLDSTFMNPLLDELMAVIEGAGLTPTNADTTQLRQAIATLGSGGGGLKNEVVNGDFRFWQRGTTFTGIAPNPNFELERYTADRWAVTGDGIGGVGTAAVSRQTFTAGQTDIPGAVHFLRYQQSVGATAGGGRIRTKLEGVEAFANRDVTVSLWLKAPSATSSAISVAVNLYNVLGTGSASLAGTEVLSVTSSWQRFVVTKPMPSLVGQTIDRAVAHLRFELALPAGTPTLDVARVQLERASVPSAFEARPYSIELALCRRYYEKSYEPDTVPGTASITGQTMGNGTTAAAIQERFATSKRARPTVTYYSPQSGDINRVYVRFNGTSGQDQPCSGSLDGSRDQLGSASSNQLLAEGVWSAHWTADADL